MKTLILMRHGEAQSHSPEGDLRRALQPRGEWAAEAMGKLIATQFGIPASVVASPAVRAQQTARFAARGAGYAGEVYLESTIYDAEWEDLLAVVQALPDEADSVLLVGHNPGLPILAAALEAPQTAPRALPPAGAIILHLGVTRWEQAASGTVEQAQHFNTVMTIR